MNYRLIIILSLVVWISGCGGSDDNFKYEVPINSIAFTIPAGLNPTEFHQFSVLVPISEFVEAAVNEDTYTEIIPNVAVIRSSFGSQLLDFANDISITFCPEDSNIPSCGTETFWRNPVQINERTPLELYANQNNVVDIVEEGQFVQINIRFSQLRATTFQSLDCFLDMRLRIR